MDEQQSGGVTAMSTATAKVNDRVRMGNKAGWGKEHAIGTVTNRQILAGAEQLGELAEITFSDGFAFWSSDSQFEIVQG